MRLADIDQLPAGLRFVIAIGTFDGVHRGHMRVLRALQRSADDLRAQAVVLTFEPHPAKVLRGTAPPLLCDPLERLARIEQFGVRWIVVQRFDRQFSEQPPEVFLERLAHGRQLAGLVMTPESAFGRDRTGGLTAIRALAGPLGFRTVEVPQLVAGGMTVSSTRLRSLLAGGRLADTARLLGRRYAVIGKVVRGDRRGRSLGYPTANLAFDEPVALPPDGIYAIRATWGSSDPLRAPNTADGVASLGVRPTFGGGDRVLEANLFDFDGPLYGKRLRVEFVRRLRGERRFGSAEALVRQMDLDASRARAVLAALEPAGASKPNAC